MRKLNHTSNDPSLVGDVFLQFPQHNGGSSIELRDVSFDRKAYYGIISMKKLEEDHVPLRVLFGAGEGVRPVMGVEMIGRDIVAVSWGSNGDKGNYMLKAWSMQRGGWFCVEAWIPGWMILGNRRLGGDIPAETMRELVDKHKTIPAAAAAAAKEGPSTTHTPWEQRALDEEKVKAWWW